MTFEQIEDIVPFGNRTDMKCFIGISGMTVPIEHVSINSNRTEVIFFPAFTKVSIIDSITGGNENE